MKLLLILFVIVSIVAKVIGIFEEQQGEFDWVRENIGIIKHSVSDINKNHIIVSTEENVIASLSKSKGEIQWRTVLPIGEEINRLLVGNHQLYTLSTGKNGLTATVKAWSTSHGELLWDTAVNSDSKEGNTNAVSITDIVMDASKGIVCVLSGNTIHFISAATGTLEWMWVADTELDAVITAQKKAGLKPILSQLALPLSSTTSSSTTSTSPHTAVGCFVKQSNDDSSFCIKTFTLSTDYKQKSSTVAVHAGLPTVQASQLKSAVASDTNSFSDNDVLFGMPKTGSTAMILQLAGNRVSSMELGVSSSTPSKTNTNTNTNTEKSNVARMPSSLATLDGDIVPLLFNCIGTYCEVFTFLFQDSKAARPSISSLITCTGKMEAVVGVEQHGYYASVAKSVQCAGVDVTDISSSISFHSASLKVGHQGVVSTPEIFVVSASFDFPHASISSLSHISHASSRDSDNISNILLVEHSGLTFMLENNTKKLPTTKVIWNRDESLARMRQAVIVEGHHSIVDNIDVEDLQNNIATRLQLQRIELESSFRQTLESMKELPRLLTDSISQIIAAAAAGLSSASLGKQAPKDRQAVLAEKAQQLAKKKAKAADHLNHRRMNVDLPARYKRFGFDKVAICLSSANDAKGVMEAGMTLSGISFADTSFRISALDLARNQVIWSIDPQLPVSDQNAQVVFVKLMKLTGRSKGVVCLMISTAAGKTYFWNIDTHSFIANSQRDIVNHSIQLPSSSLVTPNQPVRAVFAMRKEYTGVARGDSRFLLVHSSVPSSETKASIVTVYPSLEGTKESITAAVDGEYVHLLSKEDGFLRSYVASGAPMQVSEGFTSFEILPVADVYFNPSVEKIVSIAYPTGDVINRRFSVLGDDSILLKYLNPHIVFIVTESTAVIDLEDGSKQQLQMLYASLIDTVSGKIVYRVAHDSGSSPVHAVLMENTCVYSFWNTNARRTEISTIALYEGMVDKYALNPLASAGASPVVQQLQREAKFSAFSAPPPLGVQKTYVLPRGVTAMHHTVTEHGLANKNILVATTNGQLYTIDMRTIHPRRPLGEPSQFEKEEGLYQYNPFVHFNPLTSVTYDNAIEGGIHKIVSSPTRLESTSLVLSFGGLDVHFNRVMPSQGFDSLASDFNHPLLLLILASLAVAVYMLKTLSYNKTLNQNWA